ncbi:unnamed protein product [Anisakis simplex]|uniref:Oxidoreductase n=1 Tax=Anisakis simplex TaxID=6269 RepID=A0A0M3J0T9_ANISI|nr:unnamed protein product [Anisakis simplex]
MCKTGMETVGKPPNRVDLDTQFGQEFAQNVAAAAALATTGMIWVPRTVLLDFCLANGMGTSSNRASPS